MSKINLKEFTELYSLSKTLRFELIPVGKTLENIQKHGLLTSDEVLAEKYKKVKKIIDKYHKYFIDDSLQNLTLTDLDNYFHLYFTNKDDKEFKQLDKIEEDLRKQVVKAFTANSKYKNLFSKELIKQDLLNWSMLELTDKELVKDFSDFTTYFTGFNKNRENIYTSEKKATAVAYRLINENLAIFADNVNIYQKKLSNSLLLDDLQVTLEKIAGNISLSEVFDIHYFNSVLTQAGIDTYNTILGGYTQEDGTKVQGLNELINLYNQKQLDKHNRLPKFKQLYKQILSDRDTFSAIPEQITNDVELVKLIKAYYAELSLSFSTEDINPLDKIKQVFQRFEEYDGNYIFINKQSLGKLSQELFNSWDFIRRSLISYYQSHNPINSKNAKKYEEKQEKWLNQKSFSVSFLDNVVFDFYSNLDATEKEFLNIPEHPIKDYLAKKFKSDNNDIVVLHSLYNELADILNGVKENSRQLIQEKAKVKKIKAFLDKANELLQFIKIFIAQISIDNKDERFYTELQESYNKLKVTTLVYNQVRNYLTQKPYSLEKIKLNFQNSQLLDGWDRNKEVSNTSVILLKDGNYYLGIMNKKNNKLFEKIDENPVGDCYEKMVYKLLPGANKMLPKVFLSSKGKEIYKPSSELLAKYEGQTHTKGGNFNIYDCHALIDFFKSSIKKHPDWNVFGFNFSDTKDYQDISDFYREVEAQGYKLSYDKVSCSYINQCIEDGKLYLFQIFNKDFSPYSRGTPNLHTLYWKAIFSPENFKNIVYKLNGQADVFYRKKSITEKKALVPTHPSGIPVQNKNPLNHKVESIFEYNLIKDKRFTLDKFQFHVPITINFKAIGTSNINLKVQQYIKENTDDIHVIGIDRGERHLLYVSVISPKGKIVEQFSLNQIINEYKGNNFTTDYHALLNAKEKERLKGREEWDVIGSIKELKEGYLSQVVHKICKLIVKYNAIIVMEDLNSGFKNSRIKVEKQVYQKFEKMLIDKLNYLVFKNPEDGEPGIYNALQLANKFDSFKKLGKQSGFVFYVPAWNTSKIDPVTGFVDMLKPRYENISKAQEFFSKFDSIAYNHRLDRFEFCFNYKNFTAKADDTRTEWQICSSNEVRYYWKRNNNSTSGSYSEVLITNELKTLFTKYEIDFVGIDELKDVICNQQSSEFYKSLIWLLSLLLSMRYNNGLIGEQEEDYILSPVANSDGVFFDSRKQREMGKSDCGKWLSHLPVDSDANGAYNIARKGVLLINRIKHEVELKNIKLLISNKEYLQFVQPTK